MRVWKKPALMLVAALLLMLAILWGYSVLLQPVRDQQTIQTVERLDQAGAFDKVRVRYEARCTVTNADGTTVELTAAVYDPDTYDSREDVPAAYRPDALDQVKASLRQQAESRMLTVGEGFEQEVVVQRMIEE